MKLDKIVLSLMLVGLISSLFIVSQRWQVENRYKQYELTMDYVELERFASEAGRPLPQVMKEFKEAGIHSVNIPEATIGSLKKNLDYKLTTRMEGYDLVVGGTKEGLSFVEKGLREVLKENRKITYRDENTLVIEGKPKDYAFDTTVIRDYEGNKMGGMNFAETSKLEYVGLGYLPRQIEESRKTGLKVLLRPAYIEALQDAKKSIRRFTGAIDRYQLEQSYVIFQGQEALGWDEAELAAKTFFDRNIAVAMIESSVQREHLEVEGMEDLVRRTDFKAIRAFTTWQFIQKRYDYEIPGHHQGEEIVNTFYRAITERNIRLIYFKPFIEKNGKPVTDMEIYKARFDDLQRRLSFAHGLRPGTPIPMRPLRARRSLQLLSALGIVAAGFAILDNLLRIPRKYFYPLLGIGCAGIAGFYLLNLKLVLINKMMGLAATIFFPTLGVLAVMFLTKDLLRRKHKSTEAQNYMRGVKMLIFCIIIALLGAVYETAFFANSSFLLEMDIFKGVKLSQLAPMGLAMILYLGVFGYRRKTEESYLNFDEIGEFLSESIRVWQAIGAGLLLGVIVLLLLRSGHESNVQPPQIELIMRNALEYILPARPRTKAVIMAYPALILWIYLASHRRWRWMYPVLALMTVIGQSNILNTFSHIRTPLYVSFHRVGYEFLLSLPVAAILVLMAGLIFKFIGKGRPNV